LWTLARDMAAPSVVDVGVRLVDLSRSAISSRVAHNPCIAWRLVFREWRRSG
jgi:hypothetical protein